MQQKKLDGRWARLKQKVLEARERERAEPNSEREGEKSEQKQYVKSFHGEGEGMGEELFIECLH